MGISFIKVMVINIDDFKKVFNVMLDFVLSKMWLVNQFGFNYFDILKDFEGCYLLQLNLIVFSGFILLGVLVVMISDKLLVNNVDGIFLMIVGDLLQVVVVFCCN